MGRKGRGAGDEGGIGLGVSGRGHDDEDDEATALMQIGEQSDRRPSGPPPASPPAPHEREERTDVMAQRDMVADGPNESSTAPQVARGITADPEQTDVMAMVPPETGPEFDASAADDADPVVEVVPISRPELLDPTEQTLESIQVDIDRPALPFDPPAERPGAEAVPAELDPFAARDRFAAPHAAAGLHQTPTSAPLLLDGTAASTPTRTGHHDVQPASLWSRKAEPSTVDPAELPSSLAPTALSRPMTMNESSAPRSAWMMGALVAVAALAALILALVL